MTKNDEWMKTNAVRCLTVERDHVLFSFWLTKPRFAKSQVKVRLEDGEENVSVPGRQVNVRLFNVPRPFPFGESAFHAGNSRLVPLFPNLPSDDHDRAHTYTF